MAKRTEWEFTGDASDLVKEVNSIVRALKTLKKSAVSTSESVDELAVGSKKTADAQQGLTEKTKGLSQQLTSIGHALHAIAGPRSPLSTMSNKMVELGGATGRLSGAKGLGSMLIPLSAMVAGLAMAGAAIGAFGSAVFASTEFMIGAVFQAEELNEELKKLEGAGGLPMLTGAELESIEKVTGAVEGMKKAWDAVVMTIGANVAPNMENLAVNMLALSLAAVDSFKVWQEGKNIFLEFGIIVSKVILSLVPGFQQLNYLLGVAAGGGPFAADGIRQLAEGLAELEDSTVNETLDGIVDGMGEYRKKALELIGQIKILKQEEDDAGESTEDLDEAMEKLSKHFKSAAKQSAGLLKQIDRLNSQGLRPTLNEVELLNKKYDDLQLNLTNIKRAAEERITQLNAEHVAALEAGASTEALDAAAEALGMQYAILNAAESALTSTTENRTEAVQALIKELKEERDLKRDDEYLKGINDIVEEKGNWISRIQELNKELSSLAAQEASGIDIGEKYNEVLKARLEVILDMGDAFASASNYMADIFSDAIDLMLLKNDELTEKQKLQIMILYRAQQAAAITSIGIDTLVAATKALAELGPIAGPIAAAAMVTSGAINAGIVASTPPPEFHVGGVIPTGSTLVSALPGESILNRETTAQLGAGGVASLNSGGAGGVMMIEQVYGHRVFNRFIVDNLASGGPLKKQIVGNTRVGHRVRSTS